MIISAVLGLLTTSCLNSKVNRSDCLLESNSWTAVETLGWSCRSVSRCFLCSISCLQHSFTLLRKGRDFLRVRCRPRRRARMTKRKEERKENSLRSEQCLFYFATCEGYTLSFIFSIRPASRCRDKLKQDITRLENEKSDLSLELSFVRDKLQQKTATADTLEIELLELGAKLDKSTRDYVSYVNSNHFAKSPYGCSASDTACKWCQ